eukprot:gene4546-9019_t
MDTFVGLWYDCEGLDTGTSKDQSECEQECASFLTSFSCLQKDVRDNLRKNDLLNDIDEIRLLRQRHAKYLTAGLKSLPCGFVSLDSSRPWIIYWILQALYLLDEEPIHLYDDVISTLAHIQNKTGGFGGGFMQISHSAPNFAAVLALCIIGTPTALDTINRPAMYNFFMSIKEPRGQGFRMHIDGEVDTRGTYTVLAVARILNIMTPELCEGLVPYLLSCQTYEGGFGAEPGNEAHGGYNMCAFGALLILGEAQEQWLINRQCRLEGGFQGRTNKLVDSCYSYWQGAAFVLLDMATHRAEDTADITAACGNSSHHIESDSRVINFDIIHNNGPSPISSTSSTFGNEMKKQQQQQQQLQLGQQQDGNGNDNVDDVDHVEEEEEEGLVEDLDPSMSMLVASDGSGAMSCNQMALQRYLLHCAQQMEGGMRDKPGKSRDFYHSCYALSGLSLAQHYNERGVVAGDQHVLPHVYGDVGNIIKRTSAVYNIGPDKLICAIKYFQDKITGHDCLLELYNAQHTSMSG